jgi:hypothetical protein
VVHDGRLWIIGGGGWDEPRRDVWSSADGAEWVEETGRAPWEGRVHFGAESFDGRLWVFGGSLLNDVWSSADGAEWETSPDRTPWGPRTTSYSTTFAGALWVFGGKTGTAETVADEVWRLTRSGD